MIASIADLAAGTAHSVPHLCDALVRAGHHVELHVLDDAGATVRQEQLYELHRYPRLLREKRAGFSPAMLDGLRSAARRLDLLHWHGLWMMPNLYPHWATRGTSCRTVVSPRGMLHAPAMARNRSLKRLMWRLLQGPPVKAAHLIHATGTSEVEAIRAIGLSNPIAVVTNGIKVPAVARPAERHGRRRLLFLGRIHPIKAIDHAIKAWRLVQDRHPEWQFDIVGPDCEGHVRVLQNLVRAIGAQRVNFHGPVVGVERDTILAAAELHILTSHSENFAMTVAESLAVGVPVLCSRNTPWSGITDHNCGFWVDNDVQSLRGCLDRALALSAGKLTEMGARGRTWMEQSFTWQAKAEQMSIAYAWQHGQPPPTWLQTIGGPQHASDAGLGLV